MKKWIAVFLSVVVIVSMLAACGNAQSDGGAQADNEKPDIAADGTVEVHLISKIVNYGSTYNFAYDEEGNMIECPVVGGGDTTLEYDENHKIVKRIWYLDGELKKYVEYSYDDHGKLVKEMQYNKAGELGTTWESVYNEQGLLVEYKAVSTDGSVGMHRTYAYNEAELLTEEKEEYYDDLNYRQTYAYDAQGNCVEGIRYDGSNKVQRHNIYTYDAEGKLLTEENTVSGGKSTLIYNSEGQLVEENYAGSSNRQYIYHYDNNGNLIKKDRSENGEAEQPVEYQYIIVKLSPVDAKIVLENMTKLLEEQGLAPLQR